MSHSPERPPDPSYQRRVRELFAQAVQRPAHERQAWLEKECAGDAQLRAQVLDLLNACNAADQAGFLHAPTQTSHLRDAAAAPLTERPGTRIGPYKLLELLGEGGFGAVFVAEQEEPVRRRVALKIIKLGMHTRQVVARFEQERQALALMDHPNIARVLDAGATESGRPYFVMELVKGVPITEYCDRERLSVRERLDLFTQVCQAVQHAHQKGVIHRDIKPRNVLVSTLDDRPIAKVIDFGIAKATDRALTDKTIYTEHRAFVGTPEYMSPEQAEGSLDIDTRTDVYSLGVLLYELLTSTTPFQERDLHRAAYAEIQRIIREVEPVQPSTRLTQHAQTIGDVAGKRKVQPQQLGLLVRGELDWISMKALEKDRVRRYESASALAQDVQRHLSGEPVQAAPPSTAYRARKFVRRHRGPVAAGACVAAVLVLGIAATSVMYAVAQHNERAATHNATVAERAAYSANIALAQSEMANGNWPAARERLAECPESLRGFELNHLERRAALVIAEIPGNWPCVALSPDGTRLATGSTDNTARLWDAASGKPIGEPMSHGDLNNSFTIGSTGIISAQFSPDGTRLATASLDNTARLWEATSGKLIGEPMRHGGPVVSITFSQDGTRLATGSTDNTARLWDARNGKSIGEPIRLRGLASSVAFSRDGTRLATGSSDGVAQLWDTASGKPVCERMHDGGWIVVFNPDGTRLATGSRDGTARLWDAVRGTPIGEPLRHKDSVMSVNFSPDGTRLATGSRDGTARLWDGTCGKPVGELMRHGSEVYHVLFSPDGRQLATGSQDGTARLWDATSGAPVGELMSCERGISPVAFSPDGARLAAQTFTQSWESGPVLVLSPATNTCWPLRPLSKENLALERHALLGSSAGPYSAAGRRAQVDGRTVRIYEADSSDGSSDGDGAGRQVAAIPVDEPATEAVFTPDGTRLLVTFASGAGVVLDARPGAAGAADLTARYAERAPAMAQVDRLLAVPPGGAGFIPTDKLDAALRADESLTPLRRLTAAQVLHERLADMNRDATSAFDALTKDATDPATVRAAAETAELPPRVKEIVVAKAATWTYEPPQPTAEAKLAHSAYVSSVRMAGHAFEARQFQRARQRLDACPEAQRGWEWRCLNAGADMSLRVADQLSEPVLCVAASRDGTRIAMCGGSTARVVDPESGALVRELKGHSGIVTSVAFSPDGKRVATASSDTTARLWDTETGAMLVELKGHTHSLGWVAWSPDGSQVLTCADNQSDHPRIWDAATGTTTAEIKGDFGSWCVAAFSPDGKHLALTGKARCGVVWDIAAGRVQCELVGHADALRAVAFSPNGEMMATGSLDGTARVWDTRSGTCLRTLKGHTEGVSSVAFSADAHVLATTSYDGTTRIWNPRTGALNTELRGHTSEVWSAAFIGGSARIVTGGWDHTARIWDARTEPMPLLRPAHEGSIRAIAFSTDGTHVATGGSDGHALLWDARTLTPMTDLSGHADTVSCVAFSSDGKRLATGSWDRTARIWDAASGQLVKELRGHHERLGSLSCVAFSPDGTQLVASHNNRMVQVWETATGATLSELDGESEVLNLDYSPDGGWLALACQDGVLRVLNAATGAVAQRMLGHEGAIYQARFSPNGKCLLTCGIDATARIWDLASGRALAVLAAHSDSVNYGAWSPDGRRVTTTSSDGTLHVWDAAQGDLLLELRGDGPVTFSPDGDLLVTSPGSSGSLWAWDSAPYRDRMPAIEHWRDMQCKAQAWLDSQMEHGATPADLRALLSRDGSDQRTSLLDRETRVAALGLLHDAALAHTAEARTLNEGAWEVVKAASADSAARADALARARRAVELAPDNSHILNTLGVALYRNGRFAEALEVLQKSAPLNAVRGNGPQPSDWAFIAMTQWKLGRTEDAHAALATLRSLAQNDTLRDPELVRQWLQEANALFHGGTP